MYDRDDAPRVNGNAAHRGARPYANGSFRPRFAVAAPARTIGSARRAAPGLDSTRIAVSRNRAIYAQGDAVDAIYRLIEGSIRIIRTSADGRRQVCEFMGPGELFGFESQEDHDFAAEAITPLALWRYPCLGRERAIRGGHELAREVERVAAWRLQRAYRRMTLLSWGSVHARVAWFLLDRADRGGARNRVSLPMPRSDIADHIGTATETISRVMGRFDEDGVIAKQGPGQIRILNRHFLEELCGEI